MTKFKHNQNKSIGSRVREVVFGMEDGMVSTLGAITGIAIGSEDHYTVVLAGIVIMAVESISMAIGSYISNRSEYEVNQRRIEEEKEEIKNYLALEEQELLQMFIDDGWPTDLAGKMTDTASKDPKLMLKEMTYRELFIPYESSKGAFQKSVLMLFSYIFGSFVPLLAYLLLPIYEAMPISIMMTLIGLFGIGVLTTKFSKVSWYKAGGRVLLLGVIALVIGFLVGELVSGIR